MTELVRGFDGILFDLDGVVYLGPQVIPAAPPTIRHLREDDVAVIFVTNNAMRAPEAVVEQLVGLDIPCTVDEVITAAQAGVRMLEEDLAPGATVLVAGSQALAERVADAGFTVVDNADDRPDAVIQGYHPTANWQLLTEAALAVQRGATWFATNTDPTRPTDRGLEPGAGTQIQVVRNVCGGDPKSAGKPERPLVDAAVARIGAERPLFIGDRLDTDIAGGINAGMATMLVLSGTHQAADLFEAPRDQRPDHVGADVAALFEPAREAVVEGDEARCGDAAVRVVEGAMAVDSPGDPLDLMWATARLVWARHDAGEEIDASAALRVLSTTSP